MDLIAVLLVVFALLAGMALGWFAGGRPVAEWRGRHEAKEAEVAALAEKLSRMAPELATMAERAERADRLAAALDLAREENVTLKAQAAGFAEQRRLLEESRAALLTEFQNTGAAVLTKAQESFLERAAERFGHAERSSEEKIKALLEPVGARLKSYEDQVEALERKRVDAFGQLTGLIDSMRLGQEAVRAEAMRLGNSLTNAPKARGRWGEHALKNVLESCGLSEHTDFALEHSIDTADGRLRPDAIVRIPGGKVLVIDAKVSLNAYQDAYGADGEEERKRLLSAHAAAMRAHVETLGRKAYADQFDEAPDYVIMFVPGEHFLSAALEHDPRLWDHAFSKRVLLATPTNLIAIARTVAAVWRQEKMADEAKRIGALGKELYERLAGAAGSLRKLGNRLTGAVGDYNSFVGSFEGRVLVTGRKLRDLNIETGGRELEELEPVDALVREPASPEALRVLPEALPNAAE